MTRIKIKICGLTNKNDIDNICKIGIDAIGFIFYNKSPRYIIYKKINKLIMNIPSFITIVGLFVNNNYNYIKKIIKNIPISLIQFHGNESFKKCSYISKKLKIPFIKVVHVNKEHNYFYLNKLYKKYYKKNNIFYRGILLDTYYKNKYGGLNKCFNWKIISFNLHKKIILSGGLNINNLLNAIKISKPYAIDLNSGVEDLYGKKNIKKIINCVNLINYLNV